MLCQSFTERVQFEVEFEARERCHHADVLESSSRHKDVDVLESSSSRAV